MGEKWGGAAGAGGGGSYYYKRIHIGVQSFPNLAVHWYKSIFSSMCLNMWYNRGVQELYVSLNMIFVLKKKYLIHWHWIHMTISFKYLFY